MFGFEGVLVTGLFKLFLAIVGVVSARLTLFWMDRYVEKSNSTFSVWIKSAPGQSKAIYYAGRFIAVAIIVGSAIS